MTQTTNFKNFTTTPFYGSSLDNIVIRAQDLINNGNFYYDANNVIMPQLPFEILNRQVGADGQNYILAQYRGVYVPQSGVTLSYINPVSFTLTRPATQTALDSFPALLDLSVTDVGGTDPNSVNQANTGVYGGFIVKSDGSAFLPTQTARNYNKSGYVATMAYNAYQGTTVTLTINPFDFMWLRQPIGTTAPVKVETQ